MAHLRNDLVLQIPRQDQQVIRPRLVDCGYRIDRNVHSWRIAAVLVWVAVDSEIEEISADAAVVEQCIAFAGSAISAHLRALLLALNQEGQKLALRVDEPLPKTARSS